MFLCRVCVWPVQLKASDLCLGTLISPWNCMQCNIVHQQVDIIISGRIKRVSYVSLSRLDLSVSIVCSGISLQYALYIYITPRYNMYIYITQTNTERSSSQVGAFGQHSIAPIQTGRPVRYIFLTPYVTSIRKWSHWREVTKTNSN